MKRLSRAGSVGMRGMLGVAAQRVLLLLAMWWSPIMLHAHVVEQMVAEVELSEEAWSMKVKFDAGYALVETRDDPDAPAPSQKWLESLSEDQLSTIRYEALQYLEQWFELTWSGESELEVMVTFPEWETEPVEFERDFGDGGNAYFRVLYTGSMPQQDGVLSVFTRESTRESQKGEEGKFPDLALIIHTESGENAIKVLSGAESLELWEQTLQTQQASEIQAGGEEKSALKVVSGWRSFLLYGFEHVIPKGLDHILFILGLFFLSARWRDILSQSLCFTVGHTCTLLLMVTQGMSVSGNWVEPVIAATIVWIGVENIWVARVNWRRMVMVFLMGLVHGLGFASVLRGYFIHVDRAWIGVLLANVGIEIAQLTILATAAALLWWARDRTWYRYVRVGASLVIAAVGCLWLISRTIMETT